MKLKKAFYTKDVLTVANELLGKVLVKNYGGKKYSGRIVEVEAYDGRTDQAAHTYVGKTKRNEVMFNEGGYLYVYLSYGVHYCCNVVTGTEGTGTAILIRAVEPFKGVNMMKRNRFGKKNLGVQELYQLTNGPGKVCKAFDINKIYSGVDLTGSTIYLEDSMLKINEEIGVSKRIGITKSAHLPWRFFIKNNPYLSRK